MTEGWIRKMCYIYAIEYYFFIKWSCHFNNIDSTGGWRDCANWNKSEEEWQRLDDLICMEIQTKQKVKYYQTNSKP